MIFLDLALLILGFVFTFFVPGFVVIETFFPRLKRIQKLPLYLLLSVLVSTYLVYFVSLIMGFSRLSILTSFMLFIPWLIWLCHSRRANPKTLISKKHFLAIVISLVIFTVFLVALYPGIFSLHDNYYVLSAVNWQDGAMHIGIIESISQGNFPPQAPYYAGQPLNYYYFTDFHSAILAKLYGHFFPRILVYDTPFFSLIFFLSLYSLCFTITKNIKASLFSGLSTLFYGNLIFFKFFVDLSKSLGRAPLLKILTDTLAEGYTIDFKGVYQVSPMADYFLQNRPMMVGLPAVAIIAMLIFVGFKKSSFKIIFLAGLINSLLFKFQLFSFVSGLLIFALGFLFFADFRSLRKNLKIVLAFITPVFIAGVFILLINVNGKSFYDLVLKNASFGVWDKTHDLYWHIKFWFANFGIQIFLLAAGAIIFFPKVKRISRTQLYLSVLILIFAVVPYLIKVTIFDRDMFKFFYIMLIPASIFTGLALERIWRKRLGLILVVFIMSYLSLTSILALSWSFLNKNYAYSLADYHVGLWIRENTKLKSVFVSNPTVHSPVTQIGGRLRVLSYINWPHSHGFNEGEDNVFKRLFDIEKIYDVSTADQERRSLFRRYNIDYVYLAKEEKNEHPLVEDNFDRLNYLKTVYNSGGIKIYEVQSKL
jgi:hypothetical protein